MSGPMKAIPLAIFLFLAPFARGQTTTTTSGTAPRDATALALAQASLKALAGTTTITDLTLSGSATYTAGGDEETAALLW